MISIIIPVYNAEFYLNRCLQAINDQTYKDWECVLVDDGSKDDSGAICNKWQKEETRIRVIHQQNQGASIARQVGISASKGEYLSFVDADDVVEPDYLAKLYAAMTEFGTDISTCDFIKHREGEAVKIDRRINPRILGYEELHKHLFKYDFWGFPGKIYKREVFDGIYFPKATINEDYVVMVQLFHKCRHMAYVPIPLYHYMTHDGSLSNLQLSMRMMEEWENKKWVVSFYEGVGVIQWIPYAVAQAAETCCKLIGAISMENYSHEFSAVKQEMQSFLRSHLFSLLFSAQFLLGLKIMCLKRAFE